MATWTVDAQIATTVEADDEDQAIAAAIKMMCHAVAPDAGVYLVFDDVVAFNEDDPSC